MNGLVIDLFAGGGGASTGIEAALGRPVDIAINHDAVALAAHKVNHPATRHLESDIWEVRPTEVTGGRSVDVLWASPDCTHFSVAKGGKPRKQGIRSLEDATSGQSLFAPTRTITAKHRLGLVTIAGGEYQIVDIGMRMLEPHELLRAQFGRFASTYDLSSAKTKSAKVRLIGNSVCPEVAEAVVRANLPAQLQAAA